MAALDLTLRLGIPTSTDPQVIPPQKFPLNIYAGPRRAQGFGYGASAGRAPAEEYSATMNLMDFQRSIKEYCLLTVSITQGKVGGSKKRKTPPSDERPVVPRPEDRNRTCSNFNCRASATPMWRTGPLGPKSLCNACGIKYRKLKLKLKEKQREEGASGEGSSSAS
ncbi:hypothetical protein ACLB2K_030720 [Fragaria x ananassa]